MSLREKVMNREKFENGWRERSRMQSVKNVTGGGEVGIMERLAEWKESALERWKVEQSVRRRKRGKRLIELAKKSGGVKGSTVSYRI